MKPCVLTVPAREDLQRLAEFVGSQGLNRATLVITRIFEAIDQLPSMPYRGRPRDDLQPGLRSLPVSGLVIFYHLAMEEIIIDRVLHAAADHFSQDFTGE